MEGHIVRMHNTKVYLYTSIHACIFEWNCSLGLVYFEGSRFRTSFYLHTLVVAAIVDTLNGLTLYTSTNVYEYKVLPLLSLTLQFLTYVHTYRFYFHS